MAEVRDTAVKVCAVIEFGNLALISIRPVKQLRRRVVDRHATLTAASSGSGDPRRASTTWNMTLSIAARRRLTISLNKHRPPAGWPHGRHYEVEQTVQVLHLLHLERVE
jgi:hypothetical protein